MAKKNDPASQRKYTENVARDEARAGHLRRCIEALPKHDPEKATWNRADQHYRTSCVQGHVERSRHEEAECGLKEVLGNNRQSNTPRQPESLRRDNQSGEKQCRS